MKKMFIGFVLISAGIICKAQTQPASSPAQQLALNQAKKMKDTLNLNNQQKQDIFRINLRLHQQKSEVRHQYAGNPTELRSRIQAIENTRDSLYRIKLPPPKYQQYLQKKRTLINNS